MLTQDDIFEIGLKLAKDSSYTQTGHFNPYELAKKFSDEEAIEAMINFYGTSPVAYEYNWWRRIIPDMCNTYGDNLIPYCLHRIDHPLHGGGTAYGTAYLERSKELQRQFCQQVLDTLKDFE